MRKENLYVNVCSVQDIYVKIMKYLELFVVMRHGDILTCDAASPFVWRPFNENGTSIHLCRCLITSVASFTLFIEAAEDTVTADPECGPCPGSSSSSSLRNGSLGLLLRGRVKVRVLLTASKW